METKRANIDRLRLLLMAMVVMLHVLQLRDALPVAGNAPDAFRIAGMALEALCLIAVNCFVVMAGFLHAHSDFNLCRFLELTVTVLFYGCGMYLLAYAFGMRGGSAGLFSFVQDMLPVSGGHYWFMSCYLILYLLMPFLNAGAKALHEKTFRTLLLFLLFFSCFLKSVVPVNLATDDMGYGLQWFLCLYLTGLYLRLYVLEDPDEAPKEASVFARIYRHAGALYLCCALLVCALALLLSAYHLDTGKLAWYASVPFHYNFVFNYAGAVCFFLWFLKRNIQGDAFSSLCAFLAPHALGVYLFQAHPAWMAYFVKRLSGGTNGMFADGLAALVPIVWTAAVLFAAGLVLDMLRGALFAHLFDKGRKQ